VPECAHSFAFETGLRMAESNLFLRMLAEKRFLLADGATGTNLFSMGLMTGDAPELWNTEHPEKIAAHYPNFLGASSRYYL